VGEAGVTEDIPLFFTWIPILALLSNYDQEICLIHVGTEGNESLCFVVARWKADALRRYPTTGRRKLNPAWPRGLAESVDDI
jgi:hypothetical protein